MEFKPAAGLALILMAPFALLTCASTETHGKALSCLPSKLPGVLSETKADSIEQSRKACAASMDRKNQAAKDKAFLAFRKQFYATTEAVNAELAELQLELNYVWGMPENASEEEAFEAALLENGLVLLETTEIYFADEDADYLAGAFGESVSEPLWRFLEIRQRELRRRFQYDGALKIPFAQVADRCIAWEEYLQRYPESPLRGEAEDFYRRYRNTLLEGTQNTRVVGTYGPDLDKSEIESAYVRVLQQHGDTQTAALLRLYLPLLRETDFKLTKEVAGFLAEREIDLVERGFVR